VHARYSALLQGLIDAELYKTFYNTLSRRLFATRGVDPALEFIAFDVEPSDAITHPVARHTYAVSPTQPVEALRRVLADYRFDIPYAHQRCAAAPSPCACRILPIGAIHRCAASSCSTPCSIASAAPIWSAACSASTLLTVRDRPGQR
jgi:hypothetical protein